MLKEIQKLNLTLLGLREEYKWWHVMQPYAMWNDTHRVWVLNCLHNWVSVGILLLKKHICTFLKRNPLNVRQQWWLNIHCSFSKCILYMSHFFVYYMLTNYRHIGLAMKSMTKLRKCYRFIACLTNFYKWMPADEKWWQLLQNVWVKPIGAQFSIGQARKANW